MSRTAERDQDTAFWASYGLDELQTLIDEFETLADPALVGRKRSSTRYSEKDPSWGLIAPRVRVRLLAFLFCWTITESPSLVQNFDLAGWMAGKGSAAGGGSSGSAKRK